MAHSRHVLWEGQFFRAVSLPISPRDNAYDIVIERCDGGNWRQESGGYNSLSNDYAYTSAREDAEKRERQCQRPGL